MFTDGSAACQMLWLLPHTSLAVLDDSLFPSYSLPLGVSVSRSFSRSSCVLAPRASRLLHPHCFHLPKVWVHCAFKSLAFHTLESRTLVCGVRIDVGLFLSLQHYSPYSQDLTVRDNVHAFLFYNFFYYVIMAILKGIKK